MPDLIPEKYYIEEDNLKQIILKSSNLDIVENYVRTWVDHKEIPYYYEFKCYRNYFYHKPEELKTLLEEKS